MAAEEEAAAGGEVAGGEATAPGGRAASDALGASPRRQVCPRCPEGSARACPLGPGIASEGRWDKAAPWGTGKVLREENQCIAPVVSSRVSPGTRPTAMGSFSSHMTEFPRKRKGSDSDPSQEAHSQTEKRRRDKMNNLIEELSAMIPQCNPMARKLDKLTVLRMAVQHLRSLKAGLQVHSNLHTGRTRVYSGSRRSFFCRIKSCKISVKEEHGCLPNSKKKEHRKFYTIHCTGYLRSWPPNIVGMEEERNSKKDNSNFTCLVAIGRLQPYIVPQNSGEINVKPTEFITRFAVNGKFVYVDQRATAILGYLPQELLGTSCYEYFHQDDHNNLTDKHKAVLQSKEKVLTDSYKFRAKDGSFVTLKSQWFSFTNPWTKELEYIVSVNTLVLGHSEPGEASFFPCSSQSSEESSRQSCMSVPGMSTGTVLGAGSIGTDIANEILDLQRLQSSSYLDDSSPTDLMKDTHTVNCRSISNKELFPPSPSEMGELEATRQNQSTVAVHSHEPLLSDGAQLDFDALCDNDDTAMAAFMNYLEAEGGLGDPGDFSDIQWTL
nr:basic helix-loop-helix ARNT-like protein 2 isoform X12 [Gorilla gorilla gorilla]